MTDPEKESSGSARGAGTGLTTHVLRLRPGQEIFSSLLAYVQQQRLQAAFVLTAVGSVTQATLRFAHDPHKGNEKIRTLKEHLEIVSLVGTLSEGAHLHICLSDAEGRVVGGHVMGELIVFSTCEVVIGECVGWRMERPFDPATGFPELDPHRIQT